MSLSFLQFMESSQHLMRPCHIAATTHLKDTGGTLRTRRREVRALSNYTTVGLSISKITNIKTK